MATLKDPDDSESVTIAAKIDCHELNAVTSPISAGVIIRVNRGVVKKLRPLVSRLATMYETVHFS